MKGHLLVAFVFAGRLQEKSFLDMILRVMKSFLFALLFYTPSLLATIPPSFSYKTIKASPQILLEYPEEHPFGKVVISEIQSSIHLDYCDLFNEPIAFGKCVNDRTRDVLEVFDARNSLLGIIVRRGRTAYNSSYEVFDATYNPIASGIMNLFGTRLHFTASDDSQKEVVIFYRPYFQLMGDYWYTKVANRESIDERLIVMVGAIQIALATKNDSIFGG